MSSFQASIVFTPDNVYCPPPFLFCCSPDNIADIRSGSCGRVADAIINFLLAVNRDFLSPQCMEENFKDFPQKSNPPINFWYIVIPSQLDLVLDSEMGHIDIVTPDMSTL